MTSARKKAPRRASKAQRAAAVDDVVLALCELAGTLLPADGDLALALALVGSVRHNAAEAVPGLPLGDDAIEKQIRESVYQTVATAHDTLLRNDAK